MSNPPPDQRTPSGGALSGEDPAWWRTGLLYQVYIRSFADSNGDGVGDLRGVLDRLDHLSWLGVDGLWLGPIAPSPNADWGYDVADYCAVHPEYGTLDDLDELIAAARTLGIRVLLDLVPNHTSDRHPWFVESRTSRESERRDFYVWVDPKPDGSPPNNWVGSFGGPAWTLDDTTGQYYLHNFLPEQPDLNWWNEDVRRAFDEIMGFWWERDVAGFRIDVCHMIVKDAQLRNNPPATEDDPFIMQIFGQQPFYTSCRPEVHDVLRRWRRQADRYDPARVLLGETSVDTVEALVPFYGNGHDELNLGFNFPFIESPFEASALRAVVERTEGLLPDGSWPVWTGSNHDVSRLATRWAGGEPRKARLALLMLLTLRGTPVLYQGDEIGLVDEELAHEEIRDPVGLRFWPIYRGRDPERTPMPWSDAPHGGFTTPGATPWLPLRDAARCNVADQRHDPGSVLWFVHDAVEFRRRSPDLTRGAYRSLPSPASSWVWQRGSDTVVALNLGDDPIDIDVTDLDLPLAARRVGFGTDPARRSTAVDGSIPLAPWEGVVLVPS